MNKTSLRIGIFDPYLDSLGGGERYVLTVAEHLSENHQVEILWTGQNLKNKIKNRLEINLDKARFVDNIFTREKNILIKLLKTRQYDLIFYLSDGSLPITLAKKNILHFQTPLVNPKGKTLLNKLKLSRFNRIICNSNFTKNFIDKIFGVKSIVIYPPVDIANFLPQNKQSFSAKKNLILTVGRFTAFQESKKQKMMIEVFKKMIDQGLTGWEFILIGGLLDNDLEYFRKLENLSVDYPIRLLSNLPFVDLKKYYGQAKIYWHAAGFGENEEREPMAMEHFGISTVEAMASGCVPIVYAGGGQREIVNHARNGFLWQKEKELIDYTLTLVKNSDLRTVIMSESIKRSKNFSKEVFLRRIDEIFFD